MRIKICGLFQSSDIWAANLAEPDYIGFVFAEKSRRFVSFEKAASMRSKLSESISAVGVFVDAEPELVVHCLNTGLIDMAQLHGSESEEDILYIKAASGKPVIKAVRVMGRADVEAWLDTSADYLLFDSGRGTGRPFDWDLLAGVDRDFFLAGGLDGGNLAEACGRVRPWCVDLSTGAETGGVKDPEKMLSLTRLVRSL